MEPRMLAADKAPDKRTFTRRIGNAGYWTAPFALALALYWPGLTCWFQKDDFAWLGLRDLVHGWRDLLWALFAPLAQGTIRTLSERVFYLSFTTLFGLRPLPFRCWVFLTYWVTLMVLSSICVKLTGSRAAGFWAAILFTVNGSMAFVLSWTPIYYEILQTLVFLTCLWLLIRYVETGERRYYLEQLAVFVLGFGVLEMNVAYPAIATVYALCFARRILPKIIPLFAISAAYSALHFVVAPAAKSGPYKMYWDASVFSTLWLYWKVALGPAKLILLRIYPSPYRSALAILLMFGLIGFLAWKLSRREWAAAFFPAWFLIELAPLLPLRDHFSDYYLTIPLAGLAMWGGWAAVCGWRAGRLGKIAAAALLAIYLCVSIPVARVNAISFYDRSLRIRQMVRGVVEHARAAPGKTVLLEGVDTDMFWSAVFHRPFRLYGVGEVYLVPEDAPPIERASQLENPTQFFAGAAAIRNMLEQNSAIVLDVNGPVRDVTAEYRARER
jgi:hypothetical protein